MTGRRKKRGARTPRSKIGGPAGMSIFLRCLGGREFEGNSDKVLRKCSEHLVLCEKGHKAPTRVSG